MIFVNKSVLVCHFFCDFVFGVYENDLILQSKIIKYGIKQFVYEEIYFDDNIYLYHSIIGFLSLIGAETERR